MRREETDHEGSNRHALTDSSLVDRLERFGLHRYHRRHPPGPGELDALLLELEDRAIQEEWEFL